MALYSYIKIQHSRYKRIAQVLSLIFIFSGLSILFLTAFPILAFELYYAPKFGSLIKPVPNEIIKQTFADNLPQILGASADYTKASVWFPKAEIIKISTPNDNSIYILSIPKLGIEDAQVIVGSDDLSSSLIQYTGPLPGNNGNPVIFGHSTLTWLYNPKDYKSIFTRLPSLDKDDIILITVDNITYTYKVFEMRITTDDDLSVLEQTYDYPYITLVTCVPPGTYLKRLAVKGILTK